MSKNEVVKQEANAFGAMLQKALENPEIGADTITKLLDASERQLKIQREIEFNEALARVQPKLPFIEKTSKGHNTTYAKYESIQEVVRPIYSDEGFSISYTSKREGEIETYYGTLSHKAGHSKTAEISLPADTSGSKNAIQAKGSTLSTPKDICFVLCWIS